MLDYRFLINTLNFRRVQILELSFVLGLGIHSCTNMPSCAGGEWLLFFLLADKDSGIEGFNCRNYISSSQCSKGGVCVCVQEDLIKCV